MKQLIQKWLILAASLPVGINAFAYDFEVDGIYYDITSSTEVAVTSEKENSYSGNVVIPEQVTHNGITYSVTSIGNSAFSYCTGLTSVTIPNSVTSIGNSAFGSCSAMTRLESRAEVPPICSTNALGDINKQTCELFVPIKSLDAYKAADQWKEFVFITGVDYDNPGSVGDAVSENDGVHVAANNDSIEITGADNAVKTVYNTNGQLVYSGTGTTISVPTKDIYIVRVKGQTFKVAL